MTAPRLAPFERWRVEVTPLSPLHVGAGQPIDWASLLILDHQEGFEIAELDLPRLLSGLDASERERVRTAMAAGDPRSLPDLLGRLARRHNVHARGVPASDEVVRRIRASLERRGGDTEVERMTADADGRVLLPGSSLKGAMRTAWLAHRLGTRRPQDVGIASDRGHDGELQRRLMLEGSVHERAGNGEFPRIDPFRWLRLGDAVFDADATYVELVRIVKPRGAPDSQGASGILMCREVTYSLLDQLDDPGGEPPMASGELRRWHVPGPEHGVVPPTIAQLCAACTAFYRPRLYRELERFPFDAAVADMLRAASEMGASATALVRVGRHSHVENVTVPGAGARGGKSRSWVRGEWPMGWARVAFMPWPGDGA
jgi:hypothetical protein